MQWHAVAGMGGIDVSDDGMERSGASDRCVEYMLPEDLHQLSLANSEALSGCSEESDRCVEDMLPEDLHQLSLANSEALSSCSEEIVSGHSQIESLGCLQSEELEVCNHSEESDVCSVVAISESEVIVFWPVF